MKRPSRRIAAGTALAGAALSAAALTTAVAAPADAAPVPACTGSQLVMGYKSISPYKGHFGVVMEFRNRGSQRCDLRGFPGFDAVDSHDNLLAHAHRYYRGYFGGANEGYAQTIDVQPGAYASAIAEWYAVRSSGAPCTVAAGFDFTPPGTSKTEHRSPSRPPSLCHLQVHPVAYGRAGQSK